MSRSDLERLSKEELIELVLRLQRPEKTSRTSSKPPSTDRKAQRERSKPGGAKPGHEGHSWTGSSRPKRNGRRVASTPCQAMWRSSSPCPTRRISPGAPPAGSTIRDQTRWNRASGSKEQVLGSLRSTGVSVFATINLPRELGPRRLTTARGSGKQFGAALLRGSLRTEPAFRHQRNAPTSQAWSLR